jgi:hypothetical protein
VFHEKDVQCWWPTCCYSIHVPPRNEARPGSKALPATHASAAVYAPGVRVRWGVCFLHDACLCSCSICSCVV